MRGWISPKTIDPSCLWPNGRAMSLTDTINRAARKLPTWVIYCLGVLPAFAVFYAAATGNLGIEPIKNVEHELGELGLKFFFATLLISPLRKLAGVNLIKFRRALGLLTFFYVLLHLLVWVILDMGLFWQQMITDIFKRPYITIGMVGFLAMVPLAVTSNNAAIRKLGAMRWNKLHRLAYPAVILGAVHFVMVQRVWEPESLIYLAIAIILVALRFRVIFPKSRKATDPVSR